MESVEGLEPDIDAAIADAVQTCIQETDLDVRLETVTDRTVVRSLHSCVPLVKQQKTGCICA